MLPTCLQTKRMIINIGCFLLLMIASLFVSAVYAATTPTTTVTVVSASDVLHNIVEQIPILMRLVTAIAYVMGMYFVFYGLLKLKQFGEARTQMSQEHKLKDPLMFLIVGAILLYLPSSVEIGLSSFWASPTPYGYTQEVSQWADFMKDIYLVVQLFGTIAFIRGLVILSHLSGHAQHGTFGKGMVHVIGGILCINIYQLVQVIMVTIGIDIS